MKIFISDLSYTLDVEARSSVMLSMQMQFNKHIINVFFPPSINKVTSKLNVWGSFKPLHKLILKNICLPVTEYYCIKEIKFTIQFLKL